MKFLRFLVPQSLYSLPSSASLDSSSFSPSPSSFAVPSLRAHKKSASSHSHPVYTSPSHISSSYSLPSHSQGNAFPGSFSGPPSPSYGAPPSSDYGAPPSSSYGAPGLGGAPCGGGKIKNTDGSCAFPKLTKNVYVFTSPEVKHPYVPPQSLPPPEVEHNVVFIRTPDSGAPPEPIVIPPPRQENVVYVLSKKEQETPQVIEVPDDGPQTPQVYYVNYDDGDNPILPGGIDLQSALSAAIDGGGLAIDGDTYGPPASYYA
ncbi:leucine-rich repeat extensin-like protein 1 [Penaeus monodon]|uniref:leucine-rich repeat extensin-like protein 1 n=1 Tax=Penaeus monodon TaxID=6687 RepID=UPI0018A74983|nr:leucine-rich repeat extensin-like protein 1 [Penaeus monodon]